MDGPQEKLATYRRKRDFARTPEPSGEPAAATDAGDRVFVVQRHRARALHYDFRLEIDGVLASWAVPKGPTLDPSVRRAAFHVEDHPMEYLDFEGVIPGGQYGQGDVIVWDIGTWEPDKGEDPGAAVTGGELHRDLYGQKLRGRFVLVRTGVQGGKEQWLLKHKRDEYAVAGWNPEDHPLSVLSGRTNDEVKADPDRLWRSDLPPERAAVAIHPARANTPARPTADADPDELGRLDALRPAGGPWTVFGRELRVTNLDKVLFPARTGEPPVTKRDLIRYSAQIAPTLLPYLTRRALNMNRFPNGADRPGFWHKELPNHAPAWLPRWDNPEAEKGESRTYLVVDEPAALVWAANFGALEWHAWTARAADPESPSYALIDIDPGAATSWDEVLVLARLHRTALEHVGVRAGVKLTGRRGIHIWIPVAARLTFTDTRAWTEQLSKVIGSVVPELVSWQWDVKGRRGLARLDYTQNVHHKTLVAPYSPRAAAGAPVSAPITWEELDDPALRPDGFTIRTMPDRVATRGDEFRSALGPGQPLPAIS